MIILSTQILEQYRSITFRLNADRRLRSAKDAIRFVNERGFIFFWPVTHVVMPSLWSAVAGNRPVPDNHDDPGHVTWGWKDEMLDKRVWYYGRILKKRNTIISLETIPYFYALTPNYGSPEEDLQEQYSQGLLPLEAKLIFKTLLEKGPLDTISLRREAHLSGENSNGPFNRALDLLQKNMIVLPTAIADVGTWHYAFIYDLTHRYHPMLLEEARNISEHEAREKLITLYLMSLGAASKKEISSLFGWATETVELTIAKLEQDDKISTNITIENKPEITICSKSLLTFIPK
jgi:hypothetical protein